VTNTEPKIVTIDREQAGLRGRLRRLSLFSILDTETREALIKRCNGLVFEPGQPVFTQGSKHEYSYIIESGLIRTYYVSESGREITLGHWSDGDLVGGPSVFGSGYHVWSGAATRRSRVLAISGPALRELASCNAELYPWIVDMLSFKLHWLSILFQIHGTEQVEKRLVKLLLMLGDIYGEDGPDGTVIKHSITQGNLATLVGASRQWTNKVLASLNGRSLIATRDRHITLCDPAGLKAMIGDE
jgi:CRP/FNR family cyclic AMP-dependent transcriptional regulator